MTIYPGTWLHDFRTLVTRLKMVVPITQTAPFLEFVNRLCRTRHRGGLKKFIFGKERISVILYFNGEWSLFKESPPSIMVTRNPNWSTEILWYGTNYVKGKILSPLKRSAWGRLHCWFCLKLLNIYWFTFWRFIHDIPDSGVSEYSTTDNSNSGVGNYYVAIK
jgi:hypothetical protein